MTAPEHNADLVILGGGSGGYACALRAAGLGMSVVLVERDKLGGTCLHSGCIPTKALLHAAEVADAAREGDKIGVKSSLAGIDMAGVNAYKDGVIAKLYKGLQGLVKSRKINLVVGDGKFVAPNAVEVAKSDGSRDRYVGEKVVLATGSYSRSLPGLEIGGRVITSTEAIRLDSVPERIVVLGGGVIGVEFASVFKSFGSEVTVVEALPRLVPNEDEFASKALERAFRRPQDHFQDRGQVHRRAPVRGLGDRVARVGRGHRGGPAARGGRPRPEHHRPRLRGGRGGDGARFRAHRRAVGHEPGQRLRRRRHRPGSAARAPRLPAGDLRGRGHRRAGTAGDRRDRHPAGHTYCEPEVASVGLTEAQAKDKFGEVQTLTYDLAGNGKSQILQTQGAIKLVKQGAAGTPGPVVGIHMVGARVGELIGEAQLVYNWDAEADDVAALIHAHPTQNEAFGEAHLALAGKPLHAHG